MEEKVNKKPVQEQESMELIETQESMQEQVAIKSVETNKKRVATKPVDIKVMRQKETSSLREKHREKVKGMFKFYEVPGGTLSFVFKEFKGDQIEKYTMVDGQIYEIPLGVAKHLNKNGWYPVHSYKQDDTGTHVRVGEKVHRFGFQSLHFSDMEEVHSQKELITVERVF